MTSKQCREARGALGLKQLHLTRVLGGPQATISRFERTGKMPSPIYEKRDRLAHLRGWLEDAGIIFTEAKQPGVALRKAAE